MKMFSDVFCLQPALRENEDRADRGQDLADSVDAPFPVIQKQIEVALQSKLLIISNSS